MSVRLKIISITVLVISLFGATIYFVGSKVLIKNYLEIEKESVIKNLERVNDAIVSITSQLDVKIADWATWDDTYKFVRDKNKAYIKSNLTSVSLQNLKIDGMYFYNTKRKLIYSNISENESIASKSVEMYFSSHPDIITHNTLDSSKTGIISLPEGNLFIASKPILTSEGEGPVGGTLVFIKQFGKEEIKSLSKLTHISVNIFPYDSLLPDDIIAKKNLSLTNKYFVNVRSIDVINGYSYIYDLNGRPILILETDFPRTIFKQGQKTTLTFMAIAGIFSTIFGIFLILLIEKLIILRFTKLGSQARDIGESHDLSKRISVDGKDEIAKLGQSINKMLEDLKNSEDEREKALSKNEEMGKKLKEHVEELEKFNQLMVGRELKMIELKETLRQASFNNVRDKQSEKQKDQAVRGSDERSGSRIVEKPEKKHSRKVKK
ncbi:MAG: CHASE4 domain-containing protein [Candidatus Levybacteria bacterium]|nr:CHASE4 domain-containing protein [Candidatus Levybacteria bacterium]